MKEKDLINLDNQELVELLAALTEMDNLLKEQEELLKKGCEEQWV